MLSEENETKIKGFENEELSCSKFTEKVGKDIIDYKFEYENNQKIIDELQKENEEKDKQIDLMGEYISKYDTDEDICEEQAPLGCDEINREVDCKECIKQYFEKLAKEKKEDIKNKTSTK